MKNPKRKVDVVIADRVVRLPVVGHFLPQFLCVNEASVGSHEIGFGCGKNQVHTLTRFARWMVKSGVAIPAAITLMKDHRVLL